MTISTLPASAPASAPVAPEGRQGRSRSATWKYVGSKVLGSAITLAFITVVNFFLFRVINADPVRTLARGRATTPQQVAELTRTLGLDKPLPEQFLIYLKDIATGQFGISYQYHESVRHLMWERLWPTIVLVGTSTILSIIIGLWIGTVAAWNRGHTFDNISTTGTILLYSMPEWWLGLILFAVFAVGWGPIPGMFPIGGLISPGVDQWSLDGIINQAWHLVLPIITLTLAYLAEYSLIMRSALLDEMGEDYLQTARAKGLRDVFVRRRHAARNAMLPVATLVSLNLGFIVSGAITIETVFSIPGLGLLTTDALHIPDIPMLQGTFFVFSASVVVANLVANLLYGVLDPRVRS
ncbi:MAG: peptide/nickel transport system permease protein [Nocardioidaceae bacterium]|nr:peptide/nickel transport system permease protein [Nocardioidaceae bacterium]